MKHFWLAVKKQTGSVWTTYVYKCIEMSKHSDCTTENLLDFSYYQNYYKLIRIGLSRQTN